MNKLQKIIIIIVYSFLGLMFLGLCYQLFNSGNGIAVILSVLILLIIGVPMTLLKLKRDASTRLDE